MRKEEYEIVKLKSEIGLERYHLLEKAILITPDALISQIKQQISDSEQLALEAEVINVKTRGIVKKVKQAEAVIAARETRYSEGFFKKLQSENEKTALETERCLEETGTKKQALKERCRSAATMRVKKSAEDLRRTHGEQLFTIGR